MAVEYGFFDTLADGVTAAEYSEDQGSVVFGAAVSDGLWPYDTANGAATISGDGVSIPVGTQGFAKGFYFKVTGEAEVVAIDAADSSARIDRVVARLDKSANTFVPFYLKGTAGSVTPPALTRTDSVWDLRMWQVTRATNGGLSLKDDRDWGSLDIHATTSANQPPSNVGYGFEYQVDAETLIRRDGSGNRLVLLQDTGDLTLNSVNSGWTVRDPGCHCRRLNKVAYVEINMERTGGTLQYPLEPDGSGLVRLPAELRPARDHYFIGHMTAGHFGRLDVQTDGYIYLRHIDATFTTGRFLRASLQFPVG